MRNTHRTKASHVLLVVVSGVILGLGVAMEVATPVVFWTAFGVALAGALWLDGVRHGAHRTTRLLTSEGEPRRSVA